MNKVVVSGVGCCLVDYLYNNISFTSEPFIRYSSKSSGDGSLIPGQLVFAEEFEKYSGKVLDEVIGEITKNRPADKVNIGGPSIVALIHVAQLLENTGCQVKFFGGRGNDETGKYLRESIAATPVDDSNYMLLKGTTPSTIVLSDPDYNDGTGERVFINSIGAAGNYLPEYLDEEFFISDIVVFGGTALVPAIHDNLTTLLSKAKAEGCITVVNTVYDFRNQKAGPEKKWPLGESDHSYSNIDLLITNHEEALRLSGKTDLHEALDFFFQRGTGAVAVTNGAQPVTLGANRNGIFQELKSFEMPVSELVSRVLTQNHSGDTTGCGDNFAGGMIASLVMQLQERKIKLNLQEACTWGIVSGGFACLYMGGTYHQKKTGEKRELLGTWYQAYLNQMSHE